MVYGFMGNGYGAQDYGREIKENCNCGLNSRKSMEHWKAVFSDTKSSIF